MAGSDDEEVICGQKLTALYDPHKIHIIDSPQDEISQ